MIQLFIFTFVRFIIIAIAIYAALTLFKWIIKAMRGNLYQSKQYPKPQETVKPKEHYKDVKDAKFVELPDEGKENNPKSSD